MTARKTTGTEVPDLETEVADLKAHLAAMTAALAGKVDHPVDPVLSTFTSRRAVREAREALEGVPERRQVTNRVESLPRMHV